MDKLHYLSAIDLTHMIRSKEISSVELATMFLARIDELNPQLNAVIDINAEITILEAKKADIALAKNQHVGALHGLPITIKDSTMVQGFRSTSGTQGWQNFVAKEDAKLAKLSNALLLEAILPTTAGNSN
jgi:amidase